MARDESYAARADYIREWARERYRRHTFAGKCVGCFKPWGGPGSLCRKCSEKKRPRWQERRGREYLRRREAGLCVRCGGPKHQEADDGCVVCFPCRAMESDRKRRG